MPPRKRRSSQQSTKEAASLIERHQYLNCLRSARTKRQRSSWFQIRCCLFRTLLYLPIILLNRLITSSTPRKRRKVHYPKKQALTKVLVAKAALNSLKSRLLTQLSHQFQSNTLQASYRHLSGTLEVSMLLKRML